jgi:6,7-dimethyl-8-ribityllumazine synthase
MLKSKRFWGAAIAIGTVVASHFGVVADSATTQAIDLAVASITPVWMLITKLIDRTK